MIFICINMQAEVATDGGGTEDTTTHSAGYYILLADVIGHRIIVQLVYYYLSRMT